MLQQPKIHVLTFGGGKKKFRASANRVKNEANAVGFFSTVFAATDIYLKKECSDFWSVHSNFVRSNKRGYGYWLWKPYLINKLLAQLPEDDILVYIDGGCSINPSGINRLKEYCAIANEKQCLAFQMNAQPEKIWNKADTIEAVNNNKEDIHSGQLIGTVIFLKNTATIKELVKDWYHFAITNNYHLLDDSISEKDNEEGFREHRHDQSIFSLLTKKYNRVHQFAIIADETYFSPDWDTNGKLYPIWATRNKSGKKFPAGSQKTTLFQKIKKLFRNK